MPNETKKILIWIMRLLFTGGLLLLLAFLSHNEIGQTETNSLLRLSWRVGQERFKLCRSYSEEELKTIPVHMRQAELCETKILPYHLTMALDDQEIVSEIVRPKGARADRPLQVYRDFPLAPGKHAVKIEFRPANPGEVEGSQNLSVTQKQTLVTTLENSDRFELERNFQMDAGKIILVTLNESTRTFDIKGLPQNSPPEAPPRR